MPDTGKTESIYVERDGMIATVVLNRPERRNAFDLAMWVRLGEIMRTLNDDESLRCIVLRGAGGKAFAAGADIAEFEALRFSASSRPPPTQAPSISARVGCGERSMASKAGCIWLA